VVADYFFWLAQLRRSSPSGHGCSSSGEQATSVAPTKGGASVPPRRGPDDEEGRDRAIERAIRVARITVLSGLELMLMRESTPRKGEHRPPKDAGGVIGLAPREEVGPQGAGGGPLRGVREGCHSQDD
jgi:hypothetical protein